MAAAFRAAEVTMNNRGLSRFANLVFVGNPSQDIAMDLLSLTGLPDGFDKEASTRIGMAVIALALGVDFRELWPATITGATKADASIQHLKAKGKGIGEILEFTRRSFQQKVLPPYLHMVHDFTDDEQDSLRAQILNTRSQSYERLTAARAVTERVIREKMLEDHSITEAQFLAMEIESGRLFDGTPLLSLFYDKDTETSAMLNLNLTDFNSVLSDPDQSLIPTIDDQLQAVSIILQNTANSRLRLKAMSAIGALTTLRQHCDPTTEHAVWKPTALEPVPIEASSGRPSADQLEPEQYETDRVAEEDPSLPDDMTDRRSHDA
jgi:hypothetical protein